MKILFVTKTRSGYGAHVVLTNLIKALRNINIEVDVLVSEHAAEHQRWKDFDYLWRGIKPKVLSYSPTKNVKLAPSNDSFTLYDDVLLNDNRIVEYIQA